MISRAKAATLKPFAKSLLNDDLAVALTTVWGGIEEELTESVNGLHDALETGKGLDVPDPDESSQRLRDGAEAVLAGDLEEHYLQEYTPVENAERATKYVGMKGNFGDAIGKWVEEYRERGVTDMDRDEITEAHIQRQFGVDRETFEDLVVGWDDETTEDAMREILLGPLDDVRDAIDQATEEIQG